ncbi:hypothetical protein H2200_001167 [Cladophialophora chaetospira]|uniref:Uncharacterized protein n=1 Tax=Cladophialophora chaetospira TaxID=386627 RepID=A0AA38XKH1_9EURO|nr:hypothetical protein H2200_001167 [Cladophialophora chaetospira]
MATYRPSRVVINISGSLCYEIAPDGDAWIAAKSALHNQATVLIRVSSSALKKSTRFFEVQFSDRWNREFTVENPLVLDDHDFDELVGFLHIASEDDLLPPIAMRLLPKIAVLADQYLFEGRLPKWCEENLELYMCQHFPIHDTTEMVLTSFRRTGRLPEVSLPAVLRIAYLLNLSSIFAIASRQMMWLMSVEDVDILLPQDLVDLLPMNFVKEFREEALRLRIELRRLLPTIFFPDPHGKGGSEDSPMCHKCGAVPMEERWYREVICKSRTYGVEQQRGHVLPIFDLFNDYAIHMAGLTATRLLPTEAGKQTPFPCGRFRVRHVDMSFDEMLWEIYAGIGGLCVKCVKSGECRYESQDNAGIPQISKDRGQCRVSPRQPNAYPPNSYKSVTVWYLSLHTYLLVTLIVIQLVLLWRHTRRSPQINRPPARAPIPPPDTTQKSPWEPKIRMAWRDPQTQAIRDNLQPPAPGGHFRLEIDFNERGVQPQRQPQPIEQARTDDARSLRFGVDGHPASIQELDASRVLMPGSYDNPQAQPSLRGGSLPHRPNPNLNRPNRDTSAAQTDSVDYRHLLTTYMTIEELIEAVVAEFDELNRHRDGSLLRDALTARERRRLIALYQALRRRLEHQMLNLGFETHEVEAGGLRRRRAEGEDGQPGGGAEI